MNEIAEKRIPYFLIAISVFSLFALTVSYLAQYVWEIKPCYLCKLQRMPYMLLMFVPLLGFTSVPFKAVKVMILCLLALLFALASYHLLVIGGLIKDFCAVQQPTGSMDDFMRMLENQVPCSQAGWKIFGIPITAFNVIAVISLICCFKFLKKY